MKLIRHLLLSVLVYGGLVSVLQAGQDVDSGEKSQPNIVLILADDLGINDLHCYGREEHRTPNLDALAERGTLYKNAYCGLSICSASRISLMTGKSSARLHLTNYLPGRPDNPTHKMLSARIHNAMPPEERTIAEELKRAGYRTGLFGKWHLGGGESSAAHQGFDETYEPNGRGALDEVEGGKNEFAIARRAAEFVQIDSDQPYFCYVPHHSPHIALEATPEAISHHEDTFAPVYSANIESLDKSIGILLEAIASQPSKRETIILFTSDNGGLHVPEGHPIPMTHNTPYRAGKGYLYEGGLRIPLIVASTNEFVAPKRVEENPVSHLDLFPTFLELAGVDVGAVVGPLDGVSLKSHWVGERELDYGRTFYWNFPHYTNQGSRPASAVRAGKWKLVRQYEDESVELYDLESDIGEVRNVAAEHPEVALSMRGKLENWLESVGAQRMVPNPDFDSEKHAEIYVVQDSSRLVCDRSAYAIGDDWKEWRQKMNNATRDAKPMGPLLKKPNGVVTLWAKDASVSGKRLRYEPELNKNVLGYWTQVDDWASWTFDIREPGVYEVEVQVGCGAGNGGSEIAVIVGDERLEWTVPETGHFQQMVYLSIGNLNLAAGQHSLELKPQKKKNVAVMDVRKVTLRRLVEKASAD